MKTIIVTGRLGFIGSNFIRRILKKSLFKLVINIDKLTYAGNPENLSAYENHSGYLFINADILNSSSTLNILRNHKVDMLVNFAAESHVDRSIDGPERFVETNVNGTLKLLEAAKNYLKECNETKKKDFRFLQVSTDEVYGSLKDDDPAFCESTSYAPNSPYAASKAAADHIVRSYYRTFGVPVLTTNCSNNYGPYQFPEKLIPLIILNAYEGKSLPIYGDGLNKRDWLHVEDHCTAILKVLEFGKVGETYCIGGGSEKTNLEVIETLCTLLDSKIPQFAPHRKLMNFVKDRPGHDRRYAINYSKISKELAWQPSFSFQDGIRQTVEWYFENLKWCENVMSGKYQRERLGNS